LIIAVFAVVMAKAAALIVMITTLALLTLATLHQEHVSMN
jgi:hypothetical protein